LLHSAGHPRVPSDGGIRRLLRNGDSASTLVEGDGRSLRAGHRRSSERSVDRARRRAVGLQSVEPERQGRVDIAILCRGREFHARILCGLARWIHDRFRKVGGRLDTSTQWAAWSKAAKDAARLAAKDWLNRSVVVNVVINGPTGMVKPGG